MTPSPSTPHRSAEPAAAPDDARSAEWARGLAASDPGALAAVFDATHDALLDYAAGLLRDEAAARDVVQEAFVRLWRHRATIDPARSLRALLFRTARNLAYNAVRDARTRERLLGGPLDDEGGALAEADLLPWRAPSPLAQVEVQELAARLGAAIAALPPRQREALVLSRFDGLSHEEVAEVMGCAPRTVNNHLVRGLAALRAALETGGPAARRPPAGTPPLPLPTLPPPPPPPPAALLAVLSSLLCLP